MEISKSRGVPKGSKIVPRDEYIELKENDARHMPIEKLKALYRERLEEFANEYELLC